MSSPVADCVKASARSAPTPAPASRRMPSVRSAARRQRPLDPSRSSRPLRPLRGECSTPRNEKQSPRSERSPARRARSERWSFARSARDGCQGLDRSTGGRAIKPLESGPAPRSFVFFLAGQGQRRASYALSGGECNLALQGLARRCSPRPWQPSCARSGRRKGPDHRSPRVRWAENGIVVLRTRDNRGFGRGLAAMVPENACGKRFRAA